MEKELTLYGAALLAAGGCEEQLPGRQAGGGEVQECLAEHRPLLSWDCQEQLFRQEVENAEDLRLSVRLFRACLADKKKARFHLLTRTSASADDCCSL